MKIGSISEDLNSEKRISLTPELSKKYLDLDVEFFINKNYGIHLGFHDNDYKEKGVQILNDVNEVINNSNSLLQVNLPKINYINKLKENISLIGIFNPYRNKEKIHLLLKKKINIFSLDLLPRITRAQSMDVLSSQANLAGYKAVIESFNEFEKVVPMMMTAAGTIPAAKVLVIGAGVAGLQAIATAKRLGAIVFATDVRQASKEQVESLGGKFLSVEGAEDLETKEGYAKETSEEFKLKVLSYKRSDGKRLFQKNYLWNNKAQELSNEDIYNILMNADEPAIPGTKGEMNIYSWIKKCKWYDYANPVTNVWCRKVVGSTSPHSSEWIKINYNFSHIII